jgi:hypothetical protein
MYLERQSMTVRPAGHTWITRFCKSLKNEAATISLNFVHRDLCCIKRRSQRSTVIDP